MSGRDAQRPAGGGSEPGAGDEVCLVLVTGPDEETMAELGRRVVDRRLCACANVVPGLTSVYRWEGAVEEAEEALALLKTTRRRLDALEARVRELHPYDEPEFLAFDVDRGAPSYLAWVAESVREGAS